MGDLDALTSQDGGRWNATAVITIHDNSDSPISNATVNIAWSNGTNGSGSCTTNGSGQCSVSKNNLKNNVSSVTASVTSVSHTTYVYQPSSNHDPDGDSDGTTLVIYKDAAPEPTSTPGSTATPGPSVVMHVGDLDGSANSQLGNRWVATVTITVHNSSETPVPNAMVNGSWSGGASGGGSCATDGSGQCSVVSNTLKANASSATFTINNVTLSGSSYASGSNHDPEGDSNGTVITVSQP